MSSRPPAALRSIAPLLVKADELDADENVATKVIAYYVRAYAAQAALAKASTGAGSDPEVAAYIGTLVDHLERVRSQVSLPSDADAAVRVRLTHMLPGSCVSRH